MSLSDACFEFANAIAAAAKQFQAKVEGYADPEFHYFHDHILLLRQASIDTQQEPWSTDAAVVLIRLSEAVRARYDALPDSPNATLREAELRTQIEVMGSRLAASMTAEVDKVLAGSLPDGSAGSSNLPDSEVDHDNGGR
jgi:hypothetical protein